MKFTHSRTQHEPAGSGDFGGDSSDFLAVGIFSRRRRKRNNRLWQNPNMATRGRPN